MEVCAALKAPRSAIAEHLQSEVRSVFEPVLRRGDRASGADMQRQLKWITIGELSRILGVSTATLRSWELRYGWPEPMRTRGSHRRYDRGALDRFYQVKELRREMPIGQVLRLLDLAGVKPLQTAPATRRRPSGVEVRDAPPLRGNDRREAHETHPHDGNAG